MGNDVKVKMTVFISESAEEKSVSALFHPPVQVFNSFEFLSCYSTC